MVAWYWLIAATIAGLFCGFGLFHWLLGQSGWAGRYVQGKVDKRLKKIGRSIGIIGEAEKPETGSKYRGHSLRKRD